MVEGLEMEIITLIIDKKGNSGGGKGGGGVHEKFLEAAKRERAREEVGFGYAL